MHTLIKCRDVDFRKEGLKKEGVGSVELILPLIAKHLLVPHVVYTVAVDSWALTLGESRCPCAPKREKCKD